MALHVGCAARVANPRMASQTLSRLSISAKIKSCRLFHCSVRLNNPLSSTDASKGVEPMTIFSGIQPTGFPHLGNYFGAICQWVKMQDAGNNMFISVVDLHAITLPQEPAKLRSKVLEIAASIIASGIDPDKSILFQQSMIAEHTALSWVLGCLTTMPRLAQIPTYKEKSASLKEIPLGLYVYPVLQSADILLYKATHVPVGEDQLSNIQLAQHLARAYNKRYGHYFPNPRAILADETSCRIKSLRDPNKKMSKSDPDARNRIELFDEPEVIREKFKKAVADFTSNITYDVEKRPAVSNLVNIHSLVTGISCEDICNRVQHLDTLHYKLELADIVIEFLKPTRKKIAELLREPGYVTRVLEDGAQRARIVAQQTWSHVRNNVGFC